jgi:two-component system alkaline phosphatase synthesis response regulator PhoP
MAPLPGLLPRVLVVEDEQDMSTLIAYHLEKSGFRAVTAQDGELGMTLALNSKFDLIVLDLMLPSMSGIEIFRQLQLRVRPCPPVVLVTAVSPTVLELLREDLRSADIVSKPFKPQDLIHCVLNALKPRSLPPAAAAAA